jgi:hypothetical protein
MAVQRFGDWKVEFGRVNELKLTSGERDQLWKLREWNSKRIAELRATTAPASAAATTRP